MVSPYHGTRPDAGLSDLKKKKKYGGMATTTACM